MRLIASSMLVALAAALAGWGALLLHTGFFTESDAPDALFAAVAGGAFLGAVLLVAGAVHAGRPRHGNGAGG